MTTCRNCGQEKSYLEFRGGTDLCRQCSTASAIEARMAKRAPRPHGQTKGDAVVCKTCGQTFIVERTSKRARTVCSVACNRPTKQATENAMAAFRNLSSEQKKERSKKSGESRAGKAGRGLSAKGPRHHRALFYELRAPDRTVYAFKNLRHFVRTHQHLFSEYELRTYKTCRPGTTYAETALRNLFRIRKDGELMMGSWHGWTIGDKSKKSLKKMRRKRDDSGRYVANAETY